MTAKTSYLRFCLLVCLTLVVLTTVAYWQVSTFDLVGLDDDSYITNNAYVLLGFRPDTVRWAFSAVYQGIWHPMIWLSYMTDTEIAHGLAMRHIALGPGNVGAYHLTNAAQHLLSSILLFFLLLRITGSKWRSAFVAAVFTVHPLNVESVAWVAERKNTLSTLFCMLTMLAYINYVRRPGWSRYVLTLALFTLGLMAKAVLVTLPVMLLLIDYWPLGRFQKTSAWLLVREKLPMFALSAASGVMAFLAQRGGGLVAPDDVFPLGVRAANAFVSCIKYIWLMILPRNLSVCYVHPGRSLPVWLVLLSVALVVGTTVLAVRRRGSTPYLFVGWMWFAVTILPVIGIVQVADQGLADRYIYIPMIGLLIIAAWGLPDILSRYAGARYATALTAPACAAILLLTLMAHQQIGYWRDSETMYRQVIKVNPTSRTGYSGLGSALALKGQHKEAEVCLRKAIEIDPRDVTSRTNLGIDLAVQGRLDDATHYFSEALGLCPEDPRANYSLARVMVMRGKLKEAAGYYSRAVGSQPTFVEAQVALANTLLLLGQTEDAVAHYRQAIDLRPNDAATHVALAGALEQQGKLRGAVGHYRTALRLNPRRWDAANNLAWILATQTDPTCSGPREAIRLAETACRMVRNNNPQLLDTLAVAYAAEGRYADAVTAARQALSAAQSAKQMQMVREIRAKLQSYETRLGRT